MAFLSAVAPMRFSSTGPRPRYCSMVLRMSCGEACRNEVWNFIATILLPDLVTWRFPSQNERRFLGGDRNTFQRLWWRAYLLRESGAHDPWRLIRLPEDALVGLMERPGISSNPNVTRTIARAIVEIVVTLPSEQREAGWRLAYKLVRQRIPLVNLDALDEPQLISQINEVCRSAERRVGLGNVQRGASRASGP